MLLRARGKPKCGGQFKHSQTLMVIYTAALKSSRLVGIGRVSGLGLENMAGHAYGEADVDKSIAAASAESNIASVEFFFFFTTVHTSKTLAGAEIIVNLSIVLRVERCIFELFEGDVRMAPTSMSAGCGLEARALVKFGGLPLRLLPVLCFPSGAASRTLVGSLLPKYGVNERPIRCGNTGHSKLGRFSDLQASTSASTSASPSPRNTFDALVKVMVDDMV